MTTPSGRYPARPRVAGGVLVAAALPAITGAVLQAASRIPVTPDVLFLVVDVTVGLVYGSVAAVMLSRRSHPVAWLIALAAVGGGVAALGGGWAAFAQTHPVGAASAGSMFFGSAWVPGTLSLFLVVPWLIRETALSTAARAGLIVGAAIALVMTVQRIVFPMADNRLTLLVVVAYGVLTAAGVAHRWRTGPERERPGLGLLALGAAIMALSFLPLVLVPYTSARLVLLVPLTHLACQAVYPAALLVTVLRNRLWGIDLAVSRVTLAGMLTLGAVLVYASLVWAASWLVDSSAVAQVIAAVGVVLAVQPIRDWLERRVRRLVWGEATSPGRAALRLGASLSAPREGGELLDRLAAAAGEALRLESVVVRLEDEPGVSGSWGRPSSQPVERRLGEVTSAPVGRLAITPRPGERLDRRTAEALDRLEPILVAGLGIVRAARDVERARDALAGARLAERRLIRRELHDGVGPWLSGLQLGIQGARNVLRSDPAAADAVLAALQSETGSRVHDIRVLSRSLLPPVLEERGIGVAVRELAARHAEAGFSVEMRGLLGMDPASLSRLDPRVAAAAYAVLSESVINAARHSGADGCALEADLSAAEIIVSCVDDGRGRPEDAPDGVGTVSMRERVEELGGRLDIRRGRNGGGTIVRATLPLHAREVSA